MLTGGPSSDPTLLSNFFGTTANHERKGINGHKSDSLLGVTGLDSSVKESLLIFDDEKHDELDRDDFDAEAPSSSSLESV